MSFRQITGLYRKFFNNQPLPNALIKIRPSKNDFDLEAGYPVEEKEIITTETGNLPTGFQLWANASGFEGSKYVFTEPDGFKWEAILPTGTTPISIQELRAGGTIVTPPDTVLALIANTDVGDLRDVEFNALADGDAVVWDQIQGKFVNRQIAGGSGGGFSLEQIQDSIAAMMQSGSNTTLTYNDGANTLTIGETNAAPSSEQIQDIVAALITAGSNVTVSYNDAGNVLTISAAGSGGTPPDNNSPTVPTVAPATNITSSGFDANWNAATDAVGVTGYRVQVTNASDTGFANVLQTHDVGNILGKAITGVAGNFIYRVQAHDFALNYSAFSAAQSVATLPLLRRIALVVDSILHSFGVIRSLGFGYRMAQAMDADLYDYSVGDLIANGSTTKIGDLAVPGQKIDQWLANNPAEMNAFFGGANSKQVLICGGLNDTGLGDGADNVKTELGQVYQMAIANGVTPYLLTVPYVGAAQGNPAGMNPIIANENAFLLANYPADKIFDLSKNIHSRNPDTATDDGIHYNSTAIAGLYPTLIDLVNGVHSRPSVATATLPNGTVGTQYSQQIVGSGGVGALTLALDSGNLPAGWGVDAAARTVSGSATANGSFTFTMRLTDSRGNFDLKQYTVTVSGAGSGTPPVIDDFNRADGDVENAWEVIVGGSASVPSEGKISTNHFAVKGMGGSQKGYVRPETALNGEVEVDYISGASLVLYARHRDDSTNYVAVANTAASFVDIYKNIAGAGGGTNGTATTFALQSGDKLRLRAVGTTITFSYIRGGTETIVKQTTDASVSQAGKWGISSGAADFVVDNFKLTILD